MAIETSISRYFGGLPDPQVERTRRHALLDLVTIAFCAGLCGAADWVAVATFGQEKLAWLRTFLDLPNGIPSHDTFGRVFARLDPVAFERRFLEWSQALAGVLREQVVAIDGKTSRRSHDRGRGPGPLPLVLVSAWATARGLTLGQVATEAKSNEITAIPALLALLALNGCTVTIDAIGCQHAIARQLVADDADSVLALKENRPTLLAAVGTAFAEAQATADTSLAPPSLDRLETVEKGHGRLETRRVWTLSDPEVLTYLDPAGVWPKLTSVAMVEAQRQIGPTTSRETRYFLTSLPGQADRVAAAVRAHWGSENRLHWVLDVTFHDDFSRVRRDHGPHNLAVLKRLALNRLRHAPTPGRLAQKRFRAALNHDYLLRLLAQ
jgi:predicted transposase YbfD/YdcC